MIFFGKNLLVGKWILAGYLLIWCFLVILSWVYWSDMGVVVKSIVVVVEILFAPDLRASIEIFRRRPDG